MATVLGSKDKGAASEAADEALLFSIDLLYWNTSWSGCKGTVSMVMAVAKSALPWYLELVFYKPGMIRYLHENHLGQSPVCVQRGQTSP
jgi:hypothetical protein